MRYVFWGSYEFAGGVLEELLTARLFPSAIVCNPDRLTGRHAILTPPVTKIIAQRHGIPVLQPDSMGNEILHDALMRTKPDVFVVTAYAKLIPYEVITLPHYGTVGVHPSLLPRYRGATPIQTTILNGDESFGISIYRMDEKLDHGPLLAQTEIRIPEDDRQYENCSRILSREGGVLLSKTLSLYCEGKIIPREQDDALATYTKKISTEDGLVDLQKDSPINILRKIQALNPNPGAFAFVDGVRTKLLAAHHENDSVVITRITKEGKSPSDTRIVLSEKK